MSKKNYSASENNGALEVQFGLSTDSSHLYRVLSQLYSNPWSSMVRELSTNCKDAQAAGLNSEKPFIIKLPNKEEKINTISFRDFGKGLTTEQVLDIYTVYGESTKRGSTKETGELGLGSKSPFAVSQSFTVKAYIDGKCFIYNCYMNADDVPTIVLLPNQEDTLEDDGLEVIVPVIDDIDFFTIIKHELRFFKIKPLVYKSTLFGDVKPIQIWDREITDLKSFSTKQDLEIYYHPYSKLTENVFIKNKISLEKFVNSRVSDNAENIAVQLEVQYPLDENIILKTIERYNNSMKIHASGEIFEKFKISEKRVNIIKHLLEYCGVLLIARNELSFVPSRESLKYNDWTLEYIICELNKAAKLIEKRFDMSVDSRLLTSKIWWDKVIASPSLFSKLVKLEMISDAYLKKCNAFKENYLNTFPSSKVSVVYNRDYTRSGIDLVFDKERLKDLLMVPTKNTFTITDDIDTLLSKKEEVILLTHNIDPNLITAFSTFVHNEYCVRIKELFSQLLFRFIEKTEFVIRNERDFTNKKGLPEDYVGYSENLLGLNGTNLIKKLSSNSEFTTDSFLTMDEYQAGFVRKYIMDNYSSYLEKKPSLSMNLSLLVDTFHFALKSYLSDETIFPKQQCEDTYILIRALENTFQKSEILPGELLVKLEDVDTKLEDTIEEAYKKLLPELNKIDNSFIINLAIIVAELNQSNHVLATEKHNSRQIVQTFELCLRVLEPISFLVENNYFAYLPFMMKKDLVERRHKDDTIAVKLRSFYLSTLFFDENTREPKEHVEKLKNDYAYILEDADIITGLIKPLNDLNKKFGKKAPTKNISQFIEIEDIKSNASILANKELFAYRSPKSNTNSPVLVSEPVSMERDHRSLIFEAFGYKASSQRSYPDSNKGICAAIAYKFIYKNLKQYDTLIRPQFTYNKNSCTELNSAILEWNPPRNLITKISWSETKADDKSKRKKSALKKIDQIPKPLGILNGVYVSTAQDKKLEIYNRLLDIKGIIDKIFIALDPFINHSDFPIYNKHHIYRHNRMNNIIPPFTHEGVKKLYEEIIHSTYNELNVYEIRKIFAFDYTKSSDDNSNILDINKLINIDPIDSDITVSLQAFRDRFQDISSNLEDEVSKEVIKYIVSAVGQQKLSTSKVNENPSMVPALYNYSYILFGHEDLESQEFVERLSVFIDILRLAFKLNKIVQQDCINVDDMLISQQLIDTVFSTQEEKMVFVPQAVQTVKQIETTTAYAKEKGIIFEYIDRYEYDSRDDTTMAYSLMLKDTLKLVMKDPDIGNIINKIFGNQDSEQKDEFMRKLLSEVSLANKRIDMELLYDSKLILKTLSDYVIKSKGETPVFAKKIIKFESKLKKVRQFVPGSLIKPLSDISPLIFLYTKLNLLDILSVSPYSYIKAASGLTKISHINSSIVDTLNFERFISSYAHVMVDQQYIYSRSSNYDSAGTENKLLKIITMYQFMKLKNTEILDLVYVPHFGSKEIVSFYKKKNIRTIHRLLNKIRSKINSDMQELTTNELAIKVGNIEGLAAVDEIFNMYVFYVLFSLRNITTKKSLTAYEIQKMTALEKCLVTVCLRNGFDVIETFDKIKNDTIDVTESNLKTKKPEMFNFISEELLPKMTRLSSVPKLLFSSWFNFDTNSEGETKSELVKITSKKENNPIQAYITTINGHSHSALKYYSGLQQSSIVESSLKYAISKDPILRETDKMLADFMLEPLSKYTISKMLSPNFIRCEDYGFATYNLDRSKTRKIVNMTTENKFSLPRRLKKLLMMHKINKRKGV